MPVFACAGVDGAFGAARDAGSLHSLPEAVVEAQRCGTDDGGWIGMCAVGAGRCSWHRLQALDVDGRAMRVLALKFVGRRLDRIQRPGHCQGQKTLSCAG